MPGEPGRDKSGGPGDSEAGDSDNTMHFLSSYRCCCVLWLGLIGEELRTIIADQSPHIPSIFAFHFSTNPEGLKRHSLQSPPYMPPQSSCSQPTMSMQFMSRNSFRSRSSILLSHENIAAVHLSRWNLRSAAKYHFMTASGADSRPSAARNRINLYEETRASILRFASNMVLEGAGENSTNDSWLEFAQVVHKCQRLAAANASASIQLASMALSSFKSTRSANATAYNMV
jgi:hypothetical protein